MPLVNGRYGPKNPNWLLAGQPVGMSRENLPRQSVVNDSASALTTQVMLASALPLYAGDVVSSLTFRSGATAAGTPTNWWFALYSDDATPQLLSQSADQLTAAWAANTAITLGLAAAQTIVRTGVYYAAVMVKATATPSLVGASALAGAVSGFTAADKILAATSGSALTGTAPATVAAPAATAFIPRILAS